MKKRTRVILALLAGLCLLAGMVRAEETAPCDHRWELVKSVPPTCTEKGKDTYRCPLCKKRKSVKTDALGHEWGVCTVVRAATCTEDGLIRCFCSRNSSHFEDKIQPAMGHEWEDWRIVLPAGADRTGLEERRCTRCGSTEQRKIPALSGEQDPLETSGQFGMEENLVELDSKQREWLEYRCSLPDGGLILTGGMRLSGAGKETGSYVLCLNADRTVRWEYTDREKNGYTSAEEAVVLSDGSIAVVVWDYPRKIAVKFFTPQGKRAGKNLDLTRICGARGQLSDITPSFIIKSDFLGSVTDQDFRYETTLYNWKGKEISRYNGDVVYGGIGFLVKGSEELVTYGQDTSYSSHAKFTKTDWSQGSVLWDTVLDYQQPDTDNAVLRNVVKTEDGGYIGFLREGKLLADGDEYAYTYCLVRFDAEGRLLWIRDTESLYRDGLLTNLFSWNGLIVMQCESGENESWSRGEPIRFLWTDMNGTELGTTELTLRPENFRLIRDRQAPEEEGVYQYPVLGIDRMIRMEDGLWAFATLYIAEKHPGDERIHYPPEDHEYVMIRIPECWPSSEVKESWNENHWFGQI